VTTTDATAGLQVAGSVGFDPFNSGSATTRGGPVRRPVGGPLHARWAANRLRVA
jgi:hypothetical protein